MELLSYSKTDYLLNASLESLHKESVTWLEELHFWADEMSFFYKLLHNQRFSNAFPPSDVAEIDKVLIKLNGESLDKVRNDLSKHERQLAVIFKSASLAEEQSYRNSHRKLLGDMQDLLSNIRTFKQKVFSFAEKEV